MVRFDLDGTISDYKPSVVDINYADIVDRSHFLKDSESVRNHMLSGQGASSGQPLYDDPDKMPEPNEVLLRSGKLDKGEIFQRQLALQEEIKATKDKADKAKKVDEAKKLDEARQKHLDNLTGFVDTEVVKTAETLQ